MRGLYLFITVTLLTAISGCDQHALKEMKPVSVAQDHPYLSLQKDDCTYTYSTYVVQRCYRAVRRRDAHFDFPVYIFSPKQTRDVSKKNREAIVVIPGGPGQGAMTSADWIINWAEWMHSKKITRDLIIYEPRAAKDASNYMDCPEYDRKFLYLLAENKTAEEEIVALDPLINACMRLYDSFLKGHSHPERGIQALNTAENAVDLEHLMNVLAYDAYHLWGTSYGSRVALMTAKSADVATMLLDSPYPFERGLIEDWPKVLTKSIDIHKREYAAKHSGSDYLEELKRAMLSLDENPQRWRLQRWDSGEHILFVLNPTRLLALQFDVLYDETMLDLYYRGLQALPEKSEDFQLVLEAYITNVLDENFSLLSYTATECNDNRKSSIEAFKASADKFPIDIFDWEYFYKTDLCHSELFDNSRPVQEESYPVKPSIIFSGNIDAVTPTDWAKALDEKLRDSRLIVVESTGHSVLGSEVCDWDGIKRFWETKLVDIEIDCRPEGFQQ